MKKIIVILFLIMGTTLTGCFPEEPIEEPQCQEGQILVDGECEVDTSCEPGYVWEDDGCVKELPECGEGFELVGDTCEPIEVEDNLLKVYFEKPDEWLDLQIYFYNVLPDFTTSWNEAPAMTEVEGNEGWYVYVFPENTVRATVMFKDSAGNQVPAQNQPGQEITETTWFFSDFVTNTTISPFEDNAPSILITPNTGEFETTINVSISIISSTVITDMYYVLDGITYTLEESQTTITIGSGMNPNDEVELYVVAENAIGSTISDTFTYLKLEPTVIQDLEKIEAFNDLRIYQIYVAAYMDGGPAGYGFGYGPSDHEGDIVGITQSLDYIASLGMNAIWLTPIFESKEVTSHDQWQQRGRSTGYFPDDYYNVDPNFGTNEEFRTLVDEAHDKGIYVFLDGVFGHHGSFPIEGVLDGSSQWYGSTILYPESLDYFKDVATYWIDEYNIDGWRLDQSYQLYQDNYNYFRDIREAVEILCHERELAGEEWGTLGYMVGEVWDGWENIDKYAYQKNGLRSAFDFPTRYALIWSLAVDRNLQSYYLWYVNDMMNNPYQNHAQPNMFITNHDLVRFGDLVQFAGLEDQYWERHKLALSFLAAYTGPITIYYGDEYGDEYEGLDSSVDELSIYPYIAQDNVARSNGKTSGFSEEQLDLIAYTTWLMNLRKDNPALAHGERHHYDSTETYYVDVKTKDDNQIVYIINTSETVNTIYLYKDFADGLILTDMYTNAEITLQDDYFIIEMEPLTASFFEVS